MKRLLLSVAGSALLAFSLPLQAEGYLTPFAGAAFGGSADGTKLVYGGSLAFAGPLVGFSADFDYAPDFFGSSRLGPNNVTTLMGNLLLLTPGGLGRLYAAGGLGLMKTKVESVDGFFEGDRNAFGFDLGGGLLLFVAGPIGLRGDVRYFRALTQSKPSGFDVGLGDLRFWRATGGVLLRF